MPRELLEGRGFVMLRGLPVDAMRARSRRSHTWGSARTSARPRSQNAKGHLLGHVKDLGLDITRPERPLLPDQPPARVPHRFGRRRRAALPEDRAAPAARASSPPRCTLYNEILDAPARSAAGALRAVRDRPPRRGAGRDAALVRHPGVPLARGTAHVHLRAPVHRVRAAAFPGGEAADRCAGRGDGPAGRDRERSRGSISRWRSGPATCSSCTTTRSCIRATTSRTGPSPSATATCCGCGSRRSTARPLPEVFAPRYGSVVPGERGGIVVPGTELRVPLEAE